MLQVLRAKLRGAAIACVWVLDGVRPLQEFCLVQLLSLMLFAEMDIQAAAFTRSTTPTPWLLQLWSWPRGHWLSFSGA